MTDILQEAQESHDRFMDAEMLQYLDDAENWESETQEVSAEYIWNYPLSVEKLTTDHRYDRTTYEILLGTGGPASRVLVTIDSDISAVENAVYEFQDWFVPWTPAENQDTDNLRRFAEHFYYE